MHPRILYNLLIKTQPVIWTFDPYMLESWTAHNLEISLLSLGTVLINIFASAKKISPKYVCIKYSVVVVICIFIHVSLENEEIFTMAHFG